MAGERHPLLFLLGFGLDLPEGLLAQLHDDVDPLVLDPAVEIAHDVGALGADAQGRQRLHLLQVEFNLVGVADATAGDFDRVLELVGLVAAPQDLSEVTLAQCLQAGELLLEPRSRWPSRQRLGEVRRRLSLFEHLEAILKSLLTPRVAWMLCCEPVRLKRLRHFDLYLRCCASLSKETNLLLAAVCLEQFRGAQLWRIRIAELAEEYLGWRRTL